MKKVIIKQLGKRVTFRGINIGTPCKFFIQDGDEKAFEAYAKSVGIKDYKIEGVKSGKKSVSVTKKLVEKEEITKPAPAKETKKEETKKVVESIKKEEKKEHKKDKKNK